MTHPSFDKFIPMEAGAGAGVGVVGDHDNQTY